MNKTERKAIEKLALSAYAVHLLEGLTVRENYTLGEVIKYWRTAKEDVSSIAPTIYKADVNVFTLMEDYKRNVERLETTIAEHVADAAKCADFGRTSKDDQVEIAAAQLPDEFELVAFPDIRMRVSRSYSYVNDDAQVQLVLIRCDTGAHFGKGTVQEIRRQIRSTR